MIKVSDEYRQAVMADTRKMVARVETDVISPYVKYTGAYISDESSISEKEQVYQNDFEITRYATLERNYWVLTGDVDIYQDDYSSNRTSDKIGLVSDRISGEDKTLSSPVTAEIEFEYPELLQSASVCFSEDALNGFPTDFNVKVFVGDLLIYQWSVSDNTEPVSVSPDIFEAYHPTKITLTITKWSLPGRRLRIRRIMPGYKMVWTGNEIASLTVEQNVDPSCISLPYGTAKLSIDNSQKTFDPRNKEGYFRSIQEGQRVDIYIGLQVGETIEYVSVGKYYQIDGGWSSSDNGLSLEWSLVDIIGLLSKRDFDVPKKTSTYPGIVDTDIALSALPDRSGLDDLTTVEDGLWCKMPTTLEKWAKAIVINLGDNFGDCYNCDPDYKSKHAYLFFPDRYSYIEEMDEVDVRAFHIKQRLNNDLSSANLIRNVAIQSGTWPRADAETGFLTFEPLWNQGVKITLDNMAEYPHMYENKNIGTISITKEYCYVDGQGIPNDWGWIIESYAGTKQNAESGVTIKSPFLSINEKRGDSIFHDVVTNCGGNAYDITWRGDPTVECGDVVTLELDERHGTSGRVISQSFDFTRGVLANCRATIIQPEGYWAYANGEKISQDSVWTVPEGVTAIYVIVVGGGHSGFPGTNGDYESDGENGNDGRGARIFASGMSVVPGQTIRAKIGKGATNPWLDPEATTFGSFTSEKGKRYSPSYTDIRAGAAYGRAGIPYPLPNTGDGGKGGKGGLKGQMHTGKEKDDYGFVHEKIIIDVAPTEGTAGSPGASGCVVVYWN